MNNKYALIGPAILLLAWFIIGKMRLVDPLFLPSFNETMVTLAKLLKDQKTWLDIGTTLYRTLVGFGIAAILGIPIGLVLGVFAKLYKTFEVVIDFFRSLPSTALFPLFLLIFGIGDSAKIAVAAFVSIWIIIIYTAGATIHSSKIRQKFLRTLSAGAFQTIVNSILPEILPQISTGLRISFSISLIVVIVTEMFIGTHTGLGNRIYDSYLTYQVSELYATLLLTGLLGYLTNKLFIITEERLIHWSGK